MLNHTSARNRNRFLIILILSIMVTGISSPVQGKKWPQDVPEAIKFLDQLGAEPASIEEVFDALADFFQQDIPDGEAYQADKSPSSLITNSQVIVVDTLPDLCDEAIFDFRQSLKKDFIKVAGAPDGTISRNQFEAMVRANLFPLTKESPGSYFTRHDRDRDRQLNISEFVPSPREVAKEQKMTPLTKAYKEGKPYPSGQKPTTTPSSIDKPSPKSKNRPSPDNPIFAKPEQIEDRIRAFAANNGFRTERAPDDKLICVDKAGERVNFPPGVIPPSIFDAELRIKMFAKRRGLTTKRAPDGVLLLIGNDGKPIPLRNLPPPMRPPYLRPDPDNGS